MTATSRGPRSKAGIGRTHAATSQRRIAKKRRRKPLTFNMHAPFFGTRPLHLAMKLRGKDVMVELRPLVQTSEVVHYTVTIRHGAKVLRWMPTSAELLLIGREAAMETK
jgi:hypothetical protein